jgi:predicted NAD-dependent protein-ADP-ribosyltransferase YbiA (DUF1768 family)
MDLTYKIPHPTDKKGGYLSAASASYPFTLDGKLWPSVEHYMLAKRFEGSTLEEAIRTAKTVYIARHLANPRHTLIEHDEGQGQGQKMLSKGTLKRVIRYGQDRSVDIRSDWALQDGLALYRSTTAKFEQHPKIKKRLLATEGIDVVCILYNHDYGKILGQIRYEFLNPKKMISPSLTMPRGFEDIPGDKNLSDRELIILKRVFRYMKKIGAALDVDVAEDALYNVLASTPPDQRLEILKASRAWVDNLTWTDVVAKMPKFEGVTRQISNLVPASSPNKIKVSLTIAAIFKWSRTVYPARIFRKEKGEKIYLPPIRRSYRAQPPRRLLIKKGVGSAERGAMYISIFGGYAPQHFSKLVSHFESLPSSGRALAVEKFSKMDLEERKVFVAELVK